MATGSFKLPISSGASEWTRPADWLPMPTGITSANDTFVGLYAVFPEGQNYAAFFFTTSAGQYRVDWGDGTVTLHNSGTIAQYEYNYATVSNSTLTSRGYKQSMITVTAVSGLLRTCDFQRRFVTSPIQTQGYSTGFLDCILSMPNANFGSSIIFGGNSSVRHLYIEKFDIKTSGACSNFLSLFHNMNNLQSVPLFNTINVTNMSQMFLSCSALKTVPLFNMQNVTTVQNMFGGCSALLSVPLFNTSSVTVMREFFQVCSSLQSVPLFNTANVTVMERMFFNCGCLRSIPAFNTVNVTNMQSMLSGAAIESIPLLNTVNVNNMNGMLGGCGALQNIPALSTASITAASGTDFGGFSSGSVSLDRIQMAFARTVSIANCQLSRTALVEVFNNLVSRTLTTSATITISGNWGATALTAGERAIATGKNWVITG